MNLQTQDTQVPVSASGSTTQSFSDVSQITPLGQPGGGDRDLDNHLVTARTSKGNEQVITVQCSYPKWRRDFFGTQKCPDLSDCNGRRTVESQIRHHILDKHRKENEKLTGTPYYTPSERFDYIETHWKAWKKDLTREQLLNRVNWVLFCEADITDAGETTLVPYPFSPSSSVVQQTFLELQDSSDATTNPLNLSEPILAEFRALVYIARMKLEQAKHYTKKRQSELEQAKARLAEDKRYEDFCSKKLEEAENSLNLIQEVHDQFKTKQAIHAGIDDQTAKPAQEKTYKRPRTSQSTIGSPTARTSQFDGAFDPNLGFNDVSVQQYPQPPDLEDFQSLGDIGSPDLNRNFNGNSPWAPTPGTPGFDQSFHMDDT